MPSGQCAAQASIRRRRFFEQITTPISGLSAVANHAGQRRLGDLTREVDTLGRPVAERGLKPCAIQVAAPMRRSIISMDMFDNGFPRRLPGNTRSVCLHSLEHRPPARSRAFVTVQDHPFRIFSVRKAPRGLVIT
jgi:hypothetical protein